MFGRLNYLVQLDDVRVADEFQDVDFPAHSLYIGHIHDLVFLQDFDCHLLAGQGVDAQLHLAEGALAQGLVYLIAFVPIR
jgi:hypothetical protein